MSKKSPLIYLTLGLIAVGLIFISISTLTEASSTIGDKFFFLKKQIIWLSLGLIMFYVCSVIKLELLKTYSFLIYSLSIFTLILVFIPGLSSEALGAKRWLNLGFTSIQPSEILKFSSVIYFSYLFSKEAKRNIKNLIFYLGLPFMLIILEPNLSTAILVSTIVVSIYYLSGGEIVSLFALCSTMVLLCLLLIIISPYRSARLKTLLGNDVNANNSYHSNQIILALSSGGLFGKGFANSDQKYKFLPKISTDSILAVIGEETGFIGIMFVLYLYFSLISYLFKLSAVINDQFKSLLVSGIACWITFQTLINFAAIVAIIPLTGVPLPLISYGGSSLLTLLSALGLVHNIERNHLVLLYSDSESKNHKPKDNYHYRHPLNSSPRINKPT